MIISVDDSTPVPYSKVPHNDADPPPEKGGGEASEKPLEQDRFSPDLPPMNIPVRDPGPSRLWYVLPVALFILGMALGLIVTQRTMIAPTGHRMLAPGELTFEVQEPGRYILWHEYRTVFEGQPYRVDTQLPDWELRVLAGSPDDPQTAAPVEQERVRHARENLPQAERTTLGSYRLGPGTYTLSARGDFPPRVLHLRRDTTLRNATGLAAGMGLSLLGGVGGPLLALWLHQRRKKNWYHVNQHLSPG